MDKLFEKKIKDYAKLIVKVGANVQKKQVVVVEAISEAYPLVREVVSEAYKAGASKVKVRFSDPIVTKYDYLNQEEKDLIDIKDYEVKTRINPIVEEKGCRIAIRGESPEYLKGVNPQKLAKVNQAISQVYKELRNWTMSSKTQWTLATWPSKDWAKLIFPKLSEQEAVNKLFDKILSTVRIDGKKDPIPLWTQHNKQTRSWANKLNKFNFDYLEFKNKLGTNIKIDLIKDHIWESGGFEGKNGVPSFTANLPTEEVWTMPDRNGLNGKVVASLPLSYFGQIVEGFWFEFKNGSVVKYGAKKGKEVLDNIFKNKGAKQTGEIALVPKTSPIKQSGILFLSTLFDENAACHIALGACYPTNVKGGDSISREELYKLGGNDSTVHIDFMFGTDDLSCKGFKKGKKEVEVMKNGLLLI